MRLPSALVLVALLGPSVHVLTGQASPRRPRPTLTPCRVPGLAQAVTCGTLDVLENRRAASGRKIGIHFKVLRATGTLRATEAIFNFAGGPGGAASEALGGLAEDLKELRKTRDLVAVDIRGTGLSAPLDCPNLGGEGGAQRFLDEFMPASEVAVCRRQLEKSHDLRLYNTPLAMDDVEAVRAALGYTQVDLIGESYGTRSALVYMRQYPAHVRAAVMEGLVPTSARLPLTFAYDAQASLDQVLAACAAEAACHQAFPDPAGDLRRALDATAAAPRRSR